MTKQDRISIYLTKQEKDALKYLAKEHFKMPMTKVILFLIQLEYQNNAMLDIENIMRIKEFKV